MSKRRISKQQSSRIVKKQKSFQENLELQGPTRTGLVISRFGSHALIEEAQGHRYHCSIRPAIDSLVAGDQIIWLLEGENQGVVISRLNRKSVLGRPDKRGKLKPVAANITQMMIVVAPKPEISWALLDSYLVLTEHLNLCACIVLNKTDIPCDEIKARLQEQYAPLGYDILFTNQAITNHEPDLENQLTGQTSVFVGQSGVGKSSLIASVLPADYAIETSHISHISNLGRHTTSNSTFYHLPAGGAIIDSPGVREFGLWHMPAEDIVQGFKEFRSFLSNCKFRDCDHQNTPGCALKKAAQEGLISSDRLNNYVKISTQFAR